MYDVIIIGTGATGLSAAMYAGRYKMKILMLEKEFGGETATAGIIENYPGISSVDGYDLVQNMKQQALSFGAEIQEGEVVAMEKRYDGTFAVKTASGKEYAAKTLILAWGAQRKHLGLAREKELTGRGVHYCWTCDGPLFSGKTVAMVGGGDSSVKGVNFLVVYVKKVFLITREKAVVAEPVNLERMKQFGEKVEVIVETLVQELQGNQKLEKIVLSKPFNGNSELVVDGMFVEIGFDPNTKLPSQLGIQLDEKGYLAVDNAMRTNIPGVFGAGDAASHFGKFKQDITAAALGAVAATSAYEYCSAKSIK